MVDDPQGSDFLVAAMTAGSALLAFTGAGWLDFDRPLSPGVGMRRVDGGIRRLCGVRRRGQGVLIRGIQDIKAAGAEQRKDYYCQRC